MTDRSTLLSYEAFCSLNHISEKETFLMMDRCAFPQGAMMLGFTIVMYSMHGTASIKVDGKSYSIRRKSMAVFRDGQTVEHLGSSEDFRYKVLVIGGDLGKELSISSVFLSMFILDEAPIVRVTSEYAEATGLFFTALDKVMRFSDNPYRQECLLSLLRAFFYSTGYYLFKALKFKGTDIYNLSVRFPADENNVVTRFLALVEANAQRKRSLSFYAEQMGYNPKYLSSMLKRETAHSGQDLIDQYAVLGAMAKLSYSHKSIKEISNEMEFPSQSDFGKFFKRMTGESPREYRKKRLSQKF